MTTDRRQITVRLPPELVDRLEAEAEARVLGRSKLTELLLEGALRRLPPLPPPERTPEEWARLLEGGQP